jgi:hypothetical protein
LRSNRRGLSAGHSSAGKPRRSLRLGFALVLASIAMLAFAVSAMAGPGVTGTNPSGANDLITVPDTAPAGYTTPSGYSAPANDGLGVPAGAIKHVWVIILENHAYETSFTGLSNNTYLSKTLPAAGAELTNYYGTGHSSLDNYTSMVSGQGPITDDQADCPADNAISGSVDTSGGSLAANPNYGQLDSAAGANAPSGDNGCIYPATVPTVFNQLDANKTSWKVYAQDLAATPVAGQNAGTQYCGAPDPVVGPTPSATQTSNPGASGSPYYVKGSATAADQYVAKHNPLPWFSSDLNSGDCASSSHLGPVLGSSDQLYGDLQSESTTPAMNFIIPDNCSNAHDSICVGNNLSGGFGGTNGQVPNAPKNNVGGSYAADLFLGHVIPEIMNSPAYSDGGLIAVVFDEAYPQFTYSNDSYADSPISNPTAYNSLLNDEAGETLFGKSLNWEPTGPNSPNVKNQFGQQLSAGPGFNEYLDRPGANAAAPLVGCSAGQQLASNGSGSAATQTSTSGAVTNGNGYYTVTNNGCYSGGADGPGGEALSSFTASSATAGGMVTQTVGTATNSYGLVGLNDEGEQVTAAPPGVTYTDKGTAYNGPVYIGQVVSAPPTAIASAGTDTTPADQGPTVSFQLVDANGNAVGLSQAMGNYSGNYSLNGQTAANDPFYDAFDGTTGGGDTGAVLLSPYIKGGTVSNNYYNHYSLLRSVEDIFQTSNGAGNGAAPGYTGPINVSTGLDGAGHLGYAAQPGLAPFGTDVFTNSPYDTTTVTSTSTVNRTITRTVTHLLGSKHRILVVLVPKVTGDTLVAATRIIRTAGLQVSLVRAPPAKRGYTRVVSRQSVPAGREAVKNSAVKLTVVLRKDR